MKSEIDRLDVLCVGHASYDLIFAIDHHPDEDEKLLAHYFLACGGGPAANAAVTVAKLGLKAGFAGYLGNDVYGSLHWQEFKQSGVATEWISRGNSPTPLSTILVKPNGKRALINYKGDTQTLAADGIDFSSLAVNVMLFDGHEPALSLHLAQLAKLNDIPTVLDAGSLHSGTQSLSPLVDYLVASEKFAQQVARSESNYLSCLSQDSANVVVTLGERGLIWQCGSEKGALPAYAVNAVDTTGAGDAFHGAFAAGLALGLDWMDLLRYASAAGSCCCTKMGARLGLPTKAEHAALYQKTLSF